MFGRASTVFDVRTFPRPRTALSTALAGLAWLYLLGLVLTWLLLWFATDRWWFVTMMAFGPRWSYAMPLLVLVPACVGWNRRRWPVLAASGLILWFPIMDFRCPWGRVFSPSGTSYRVLTCNLHDEECDPTALEELVSRENPDFIALQEIDFEAVRSVVEGYQVVQFGGLLIASRFPLHEEGGAAGAEPPHVYPRTHMLLCSADTPQGKLFVGCVHLPSPRYGLSGVLSRKTGIQLSKRRSWRSISAFAGKNRRPLPRSWRICPDRSSWPAISTRPWKAPSIAITGRRITMPFRGRDSVLGRRLRTVRRIPFGVAIDHILSGARSFPRDVGSVPRLAPSICR